METFYETIKNFVLTKVVPFVRDYLVRWSLKFAGSVLAYLGWNQGQYEELIGGILTFIVGAILSKIIEKKKIENAQSK